MNDEYLREVYEKAKGMEFLTNPLICLSEEEGRYAANDANGGIKVKLCVCEILSPSGEARMLPMQLSSNPLKIPSFAYEEGVAAIDEKDGTPISKIIEVFVGEVVDGIPVVVAAD